MDPSTIRMKSSVMVRERETERREPCIMEEVNE
jgi:hypothetical protein